MSFNKGGLCSCLPACSLFLTDPMQTRIIKATGFLFLSLMRNTCAEVNVLTKTFVLSFKHLTAAGCQCVKKIHLLIAKFSFYYFSCVPINAKPFSFFFLIHKELF
uniref:Uncharacterized protein n=1 Tax=Rhipicephalus zambeziensis TaxID=60191 RepID=A0A224YR15_9ACAR